MNRATTAELHMPVINNLLVPSVLWPIAQRAKCPDATTPCYLDFSDVVYHASPQVAGNAGMLRGVGDVGKSVAATPRQILAEGTGGASAS